MQSIRTCRPPIPPSCPLAMDLGKANQPSGSCIGPGTRAFASYACRLFKGSGGGTRIGKYEIFVLILSTAGIIKKALEVN